MYSLRYAAKVKLDEVYLLKAKRRDREKQHFVPEVYLKRFANSNGRINLKHLIDDSVRPTAYGSAMLERGIYDLSDILPDENKNLAGATEEYFSDLESEYATVMSNSLDRDIQPNNGQIDKIGIFVHALSCRNPVRQDVADRIRSEGWVEMSDEVHEISKNFGLLAYGTSFMAFGKMFKPPHYEFVECHSKATFNSSDNPASNWLENKGQWFQYGEKEGQLAITMDSYKRLSHSEKLSLKQKDNAMNFMEQKLLEARRIVCPLSPRYLLVIKRSHQRLVSHRKASKKEMLRWNELISSSANRFEILS